MAQNKEKFDVAGQQLGTIYAKAIYAAAESAETVDVVREELDSLVTNVLDKFPDFEAFLGSEMVAAEEKHQAIDRVFASRASQLVLNTLKVLADNHRLGFLREINRQFAELHNEKIGQVRVDLTTATPLAEDLTQKLTEQIASMLRRRPQLVAHTDPGLIGGMLLRVGDTVYDGSVAAQLERMRGQLRQRSTEEIDINTERFQYESTDL